MIDHRLDLAAGELDRSSRWILGHELCRLDPECLVHGDERPHFAIIFAERRGVIAAAAASSPASTYAPMRARLEPWPDIGEAQYAASPTRTTRSRAHVAMATCAAMSKYQSGASGISSRRRGTSHPTSA